MGRAAHSLARSALSLLLTPPTTTFLTHLSLCVAAASPPADTCPAVTGRDVRRAAEARIDLPPFPHKLHIKGGGGGGHRHPPQANNVWYGEGMRKAKLTVLLVVGKGNFAQPLLIVTQRQKCDALVLQTAAFFHPPPSTKNTHPHAFVF